MSSHETTRWTLVEAAASGDRAAREAFVVRYQPVVRAYLAARWKGSKLAGDIDDTTQEVFLQCLREGGGLERSQQLHRREFRPYLLGIVRNVARMAERDVARKRSADEFQGSTTAVDDTRPSRVFDMVWARSLISAALQRMEERSAGSKDARQRLTFLRARFQDDLPVRRIAAAHRISAPQVHRAITRGKDEFRSALMEVMSSDRDAPATDREIAELLDLAQP